MLGKSQSWKVELISETFIASKYRNESCFFYPFPSFQELVTEKRGTSTKPRKRTEQNLSPVTQYKWVLSKNKENQDPTPRIPEKEEDKHKNSIFYFKPLLSHLGFWFPVSTT